MKTTDVNDGLYCLLCRCGPFIGPHGYPVVCARCHRRMKGRDRRKYKRTLWPVQGEKGQVIWL